MSCCQRLKWRDGWASRPNGWRSPGTDPSVLDLSGYRHVVSDTADATLRHGWRNAPINRQLNTRGGLQHQWFHRSASRSVSASVSMISVNVSACTIESVAAAPENKRTDSLGVAYERNFLTYICLFLKETTISRHRFLRITLQYLMSSV